MRRLYSQALLLLMLLLSGCLFWGGSGILTLSLDEQGYTAEQWEITLTSAAGAGLLMVLETPPAASFRLPEGVWTLRALARNQDGDVVAESGAVKVNGGKELTLTLPLSRTSGAPSQVRLEKLTHTWTSDGVVLDWASTGEGAGRWQVWSKLSGALSWERLKELPAWETTYNYSSAQAAGRLYALRFVPAGDSGFPTTLLLSSGARPGRLDISWQFEHDFPEAPTVFSAQALLSPSKPQPRFTDLVAHFDGEQSFTRRQTLLAELGLVILDEIAVLQVCRVEPGPDAQLTLEELSTYVGAEFFLEPNWIVGVEALELAAPPEWYLDYLKVAQAWEKTRGHPNVRIAVLDTGLRPGSLPVSVGVLPGYNFVDDKRDTADDYAPQYHGTEVAGLICEVIPLVSIQPIKVLGSGGLGTDFSVAQGLLYAADLLGNPKNPTPAQIINLSLGHEYSASSELRTAVQRVAQQGNSLIVAASGNTRTGPSGPGVFYPARYAEVVAVGAVAAGSAGPVRARYSHYGPELDLVAPPGTPHTPEGTSFSTALVSGVAGLMLAAGIEAGQLRAVLERSAVDLGPPGWDQEYGHGLVNAYWAVHEATTFTVTVRNSQGHLTWQSNFPLTEDSIKLTVLPDEYVVEGWLNVRGAPSAQRGDYYALSAPVRIGDDQERGIHLTLCELLP